jgi:septal ring factor EnvC (AmiA/AmiB activator)
MLLWKAEHEGEVAAAESGLPAPLLEAVRMLHQHMHAGFDQQAAALKERHAQALQEASIMQQQLRAKYDALKAASVVLDTELGDTRRALSRLQQQVQEQHTALATLRIENDGLQQRLAD